jgi:hypothetical protein
MIKYYYLAFVLAPAIIKSNEVDIKFARNYFENRGIREIVAFGCWNIYGTQIL